MKKLLGEAAGWTTEALETACGWALCAGLAYAVLFVDIGGRGALWPHLRAIWSEGRAAPAAASSGAVRVITLSREERRDDSFRYLRAEAPRVAVVAVQERPESALNDGPADPAAAGDWKRPLQGELRRFTVYGEGDESSSASLSARRAPEPAAQAAFAAAAPQSAYRQGARAAARPAVGARARAVGQNGADSVRNFR